MTPPDAVPPKTPADAAPPLTAAAAAAALSKSSQDAITQLRSNADLAGKALAGLGTAAATALGVTKLASVFPQPSGWLAVVLIVGLVLGLAGALLAVLFLAVRLWQVGEPVPSSSNADQMLDDETINKDEAKIVKRVYDEVAKLNGVQSLLAYEARGHRLQRIADRMQSPDEASTKQAQALMNYAMTIQAEVLATQDRATYLVIRRRAAKALSGGQAIGVYALFVAGLIAVSLTDSALATRSSQPAANVALAKSCADAAKAVKDAGIVVSKPPADKTCQDAIGTATIPAPAPTPTSTTTTPPAPEVGNAMLSLVQEYRACLAAHTGAASSSCAPMRSALAALAGT